LSLRIAFMTTTIDLASATPSLEELLALAAAGNEVQLVRGGTPVATISPPPPAKAPQQRIPGSQPGAFTWVSDDFDDPLPDSFWLGGDA
jgi:antitoxin (DNA-binding transcriptional repressor) of toxin-antitoxin stability system